MNRRQTLLGLSALAGHVLFPRVLEAFVRAPQTPGAWRPEVLSAGQADTLAEVVETIIPTTDTPGARAARVPVFIDLALAHCVGRDERKTVLDALDRLGAAFASGSTAEREARLSSMDPKAFGLLKEWTLLGYFTSEVGCTQALAYEAVPGEYKGCLDLRPGQRAWATR